MRKITINNKEYTLEYTIEASLYDDCTKSIMDMFIKGGMAQGAAESNEIDNAVDTLINTIANLPQRTLTVFYAGLLEHHSDSVKGKADAKNLLAAYLKENQKSFRDVLEDLMEVMADDNFFDLIGLTQFSAEVSKEAEKKPKKAGKSLSETT